jgi:hypothetical protein
LSDKPDKKHPWAKFRAEPGVSRTPKVELPSRPAPAPAALPAKPAPRPERPLPGPRPAPARAPGPSAATPAPAARGSAAAPARPPAEASSPVSDELAAALKKLAAEYAAPAVTNAPFVTAMQRQEEIRERKRESRRRLLTMAVVVLVAGLALHFTVTRILYRTPEPDAVEAHVQALPELVLPFYSTNRQPLQPGTVVYAETDRVDANRIRYAAEVTLRLRKPIYVPASTNGTAVYRQLQESLQLARQRDIKFSLFPPGESPPHPDLPLLLQVSHRAGESITVRVPFEARRYGWGWRLLPAQIPLRSVNRTLTGDSIDYYADTPYLIFGQSGTMAEVRLLMRQARAYIIAVAQEVQRHADVEAVAETPPPAPSPSPDAPAADSAAQAANKPALSLEELTRLIDPNAPAVVAPPGQPGESPVPSNPAIDPNTLPVRAPPPRR